MTKVTDELPGKNSNEINEAEIKAKLIAEFQQKEIKRTNFPTEVVTLPSKGLLYPENNPLASGQLELKYMTAKEEDILTTTSLIKAGLVVDKLLQSLIVTPINYNDLLIIDKNALMIAARILGYGKDYKVSIKCPSCGHEHTEEFDLTQLPENTIDDNICTRGKNEFSFVLPQTKRTITFKILSVGDDTAITQEVKATSKLKSAEAINREMSTRLKHIITSVDGNTDKAFIRNFVDNELFAQDSRALRHEIRRITPPNPMQFNFQCTECDHAESDMSIPFDTEFFWPRA